jgi:hypothetical protein
MTAVATSIEYSSGSAGLAAVVGTGAGAETGAEFELPAVEADRPEQPVNSSAARALAMVSKHAFRRI